MKLPEGWKNIELGEIFSFEKKSKVKAGDGKKEGKYKFFTSSSERAKFIDEYNFDGEFLIFGTGGSASTHYCNEKFSTSTDCFVVKVSDKIMAKYVYYFLFGNIHILGAGFKGSGLKHISKKYIEKINIPYPESKQEQKKIISTIEKAEEAKNLRKDADELTRDYLNSVFLGMFGNLVVNEKGFEKQKIGDLAIKITDGTHKTPKYKSEGVTFLSAKNIINEELSFKDVKYISKEEHKDLIKRCNSEKGDVLLTKSGSIGSAAIIRSTEEFSIFESLALIKFNHKVLNPFFLKFILNHPITKQDYQRSIKGVAIRHLHLIDIRNLSIVYPPIGLQNKFAKIVEDVEKMKEHQKESKQQIDNLFNAIMQKTFKGELVL